MRSIAASSGARPKFYKELTLGAGPGKLEVDLCWSSENGLYSRAIGAIDSIDCFGEWSVLTDYKRKKVPALNELTVGRDLQLSFYAFALSETNSGPFPRNLSKLILGYWSILDGGGILARWEKVSGISPSKKVSQLAELCSLKIWSRT